MPIFEAKPQALKQDIPVFSSGDTVKVHQKIKEVDQEKGTTKERIQVFEGLIISRHGGSGVNATFTIRKISSGIGVERIFPLHSPAIAKIEVVRSGKVRKANIYYVRERNDNQPRFRKNKTRK